MTSPLIPKRRFGQNFLVSSAAINGIVEETLDSPAPELLEIGPGAGALTQALLKDGRPLTVLELDPEAAQFIQSQYGNLPHFHLNQGDAVQMPWPEGGPWAVVGNLPYNAATAIYTRLLLEAIPWERLVLMFQREVGDKLMAKAGGKDYGPLSVLTQLCVRPERLLRLGPGAFRPSPKVESIVLAFRPLEGALPLPLRSPFLSFLHRAFAHRRKTLANNLGALEALQQSGLSSKIRAEELNPTQLWDLFQKSASLIH